MDDAAHAPHHAVLDEASRLAVVRLGQRVRVAGVAELMGRHLQPDPRRIAQLTAAYEALFPRTLKPGPLVWCGLRPTTPDGPPIIGATPITGLWLNVGHGGYGWTLSCGSARLLADQMQGRTPALDTGDYAVHRFHHR